MNNLITSLILISTSLLFNACNQPDDITVIMTPKHGDIIAKQDLESVKFEIALQSDNELHEINVQLYEKENPENLIINQSSHNHLLEYSVDKNIDLSNYTSGTEFIFLVSIAQYHDGSAFRIPMTTFSIE
ncbi:MAG: hypothetical protein ACPGLV_01965 [Bacteroidia bacterium]